jgi:hypothetical protein
MNDFEGLAMEGLVRQSDRHPREIRADINAD